MNSNMSTNKFEEMRVKRQLEVERPQSDLAIIGIIIIALSILMLILKSNG